MLIPVLQAPRLLGARLGSVLLAVGVLLGSASSQGAVTVHSDKAAFLSATNAVLATSPYPLGLNTPVFSSAGPFGDVVFDTTGLQVGFSGHIQTPFDWSALLPGIELAISGFESIGIALPQPVSAFGFDFVEPTEENVLAEFIDSTFDVELRRLGVPIDSFQFNAANDVAAFVGVASELLFDEVVIVEVVGGVGNEFYGQVYIDDPPPLPFCQDGIDNDEDGLIDFPSDPGCRHSQFSPEDPECDDGFDNDSDLLKDADDPECDNRSDRSEEINCADGVDNDADGAIDTADIGCKNASWPLEEPQCSDGVDNDSDGLVDWDGGGVGPKDPECSKAWNNRESISPCGLGVELAVVLGALALTARRFR